MKKMNEKIVTTLVEKEGKTWKPRYLAHYLFGDSRGDAIVLGVITHIWFLLGFLCLGVAFHEIPHDSPFPTAPKIGLVLMTLCSYKSVLLIDVEIIGELRGFFQSYFLAGNLLVQAICNAAMYWELDPLYAVLLIFLYMPTILWAGCIDACPFHLFGNSRLYKVACLFVVLCSQCVNGANMFFGNFKHIPNGNVYDPVLFAGTHVETKLTSIAFTCITNIGVSNFMGCFFNEQILHSHEVIKKSSFLVKKGGNLNRTQKEFSHIRS